MNNDQIKPKGTADGVPVYCSHDVIVKTADMKPNPKNPNQHPDEQLRRLGAIIRAAGWRNPITVSTRSGLIVRGHGRLLAAQMAGLNEVPVDYQNYATEADELADLVADNRIAELSDPDMQKLAEVFASIEGTDTSLDLTGYSQDEYAEIEGGAGAAIGFDYLQGSGSRGIGAETERCGTIRIQPHIAVCQKPIGFNYTNSITAKTNPTIDKAEALRASGGGGAAVCYALDRASFNQGINAQYNPSITDDGIIQTIVSKGPGAVCVKDSAEVYDARGNGNGEIVPTITGDHNDRITDYTAVVTQKPTYCLQGNGIDRTEKSGCNGKGVKEGVCYTLNTTDRPAVSDGAEGYIVRRLTPLECERLQGFPDGWTDIGEWVDVKGKTRQTTDAARYKALGNSIAIPPWKWVLKRLCANYERDATMASLFDGIGGFPLIWERLNGAGTCIWASEIEEFPIAVTKKHFQGATV